MEYNNLIRSTNYTWFLVMCTLDIIYHVIFVDQHNITLMISEVAN